MAHVRQKAYNQSGKSVLKQANINKRTIAIARNRGLTTEQLLEYDIVPSLVLFGPTTGLIVKASKSELLSELETYLKPNDYTYQSAAAAFVVDVMANIRELRLTGLLTFGDLVNSLWETTSIYRRWIRTDYVPGI